MSHSLCLKIVFPLDFAHLRGSSNNPDDEEEEKEEACSVFWVLMLKFRVLPNMHRLSPDLQPQLAGNVIFDRLEEILCSDFPSLFHYFMVFCLDLVSFLCCLVNVLNNSSTVLLILVMRSTISLLPNFVRLFVLIDSWFVHASTILFKSGDCNLKFLPVGFVSANSYLEPLVVPQSMLCAYVGRSFGFRLCNHLFSPVRHASVLFYLQLVVIFGLWSYWVCIFLVDSCCTPLVRSTFGSLLWKIEHDNWVAFAVRYFLFSLCASFILGVPLLVRVHPPMDDLYK